MTARIFHRQCTVRARSSGVHLPAPFPRVVRLRPAHPRTVGSRPRIRPGMLPGHWGDQGGRATVTLQ